MYQIYVCSLNKSNHIHSTYITMSSRSNYRKIHQSEPTSNEYEEELVKRARAERLDKITAKIHAVFWVASSIAILIYTDIFNVALYNEKVNRYLTLSTITTLLILLSDWH